VAGRRENGLTAIAVTPAARVAAWLATARERAVEPEVILPAPMLLMPPGEGLVCYRGAEEEAGAPDYRGTARAFSIEDDLAELVLRDAHVARLATMSARQVSVLCSPIRRSTCAKDCLRGGGRW
jgi:hypothetical protein